MGFKAEVKTILLSMYGQLSGMEDKQKEILALSDIGAVKSGEAVRLLKAKREPQDIGQEISQKLDAHMEEMAAISTRLLLLEKREQAEPSKKLVQASESVVGAIKAAQLGFSMEANQIKGYIGNFLNEEFAKWESLRQARASHEARQLCAAHIRAKSTEAHGRVLPEHDEAARWLEEWAG